MKRHCLHSFCLLCTLLPFLAVTSCHDSEPADDPAASYVVPGDMQWFEVSDLAGKIFIFEDKVKFSLDDPKAFVEKYRLSENAALDVNIANFNEGFLKYKDGCRVSGQMICLQIRVYTNDTPDMYSYNLIIDDIREMEEPGPGPTPQPEVYASEFVAGRIDINTGGVEIKSKEDYVDCTISVSHPVEEDWAFENAKAGIRGRGNSTWEWYPKKPYRIKFDKKQEVFGLPAAKSWVLLAEYRDPTDLMNAFVFELGQLLEMPATNHNRYAEVWLNGEYIGMYHVTEQVQQNKNRVNIDETTGYLIQLDKDDGPELAPRAGDNFWSKVYGMPVCVKNPDTPSAARLAEVRDDLALLEQAIHSRDWAQVESLLNVETMANFVAIQELVYNVELDAPRSMYMHRDPLAKSRWTMGPLWDFDAGFDFDWATMTTGHNYFASYRELVLGTSPATYAGTTYRVPKFFSELFLMPEFVKLYKEQWAKIASLVPEAMDAAEKYYLANDEAFKREARLWPIGKNQHSQIGLMKSWLSNRVSYLNTIVNGY